MRKEDKWENWQGPSCQFIFLGRNASFLDRLHTTQAYCAHRENDKEESPTFWEFSRKEGVANKFTEGASKKEREW
jgi:hypothetical protein